MAESALSAGAWFELDLLRKRREEFGLPLPQPVPSRDLIQRGALIGLGLVGTASLACLVVVLINRWLQQRELSLVPAVTSHQKFQERIASTAQDIERLKTGNRVLAEGIAGVRSGSALLTEITRLVPKKLQLNSLKVSSSVLELSGLVPQPLGLEQVNALQLLLEGSRFFESNGVSLVKASEISSALPSSSSDSTASRDKVASFSFDIKALFNAKTISISAQELRNLGSYGSAIRRELLVREGLLP